MTSTAAPLFRPNRPLQWWFDQRMHYYDESGLTAEQRDQMILELRRRGYSIRAIAKQVKMSVGGVHYSLQRIAEGLPGRDPRP